MKRLTFLMCVGILLAVSVAPAAAQGGREDDRVCFYRDVQYQGQAWCYRAGDELADLRDRRNEISSLRIFGRARAIVFDEREFLGASDEFDMDVPDLTLRVMEGAGPGTIGLTRSRSRWPAAAVAWPEGALVATIATTETIGGTGTTATTARRAIASVSTRARITRGGRSAGTRARRKPI